MDFRDADTMEAVVWRTLADKAFILIGPDAWDGERELTGYSFGGSGRLYAVVLDHRSATARLTIETTLRDIAKTEIDVRERGYQPDGSILVSVDGAAQSMRYLRRSAGPPGSWAAVGTVGAVGLGVEAHGLKPFELRLVTAVDPRLYQR